MGGERGERRKAMETDISHYYHHRLRKVVNAVNAERQWRRLELPDKLFRSHAASGERGERRKAMETTMCGCSARVRPNVVNAVNAERQWRHRAVDIRHS